ncbi:conserved Plasmodium protein, unknown function [Plasmodium ovale wallikeri]|uniref:Uncharacterized protein n=2 Tax=Plasmodium ovale TaxID=36330 RepID=A0A1A8ZQG4_PLAOA|nr:conserved Plasmodium protein, unknown function [Plasmodium ovale wallikeri]SBT46879.1 conserved Plasmodium protein, unknown function [Plasmodium ovale wallikeri]SBT78984.1 conserved Plasmodium protein, unknown function [Plasmodium ovale]
MEYGYKLENGEKKENENISAEEGQEIKGKEIANEMEKAVATAGEDAAWKHLPHGGIKTEKDNVENGSDSHLNRKDNQHCDELQHEINKMIERNVVYLNINSEAKKKTLNKASSKNVKTVKSIKKNKDSKFKKMIQAGKKLEKELLDEISERRKKKKKKLEEKKAKSIEGQVKVGNMAVIKDISKIRKKDKKTKNKIFKLSSEVINKIMKKK